MYLDDVIVYGSTFVEDLKRLQEVFVRFISAGLKLKPSKCVYFGHVVSESSIKTDPAKVERVCEWPVPDNVTELKKDCR